MTVETENKGLSKALSLEAIADIMAPHRASRESLTVLGTHMADTLRHELDMQFGLMCSAMSSIDIAVAIIARDRGFYIPTDPEIIEGLESLSADIEGNPDKVTEHIKRAEAYIRLVSIIDTEPAKRTPDQELELTNWMKFSRVGNYQDGIDLLKEAAADFQAKALLEEEMNYPKNIV